MANKKLYEAQLLMDEEARDSLLYHVGRLRRKGEPEADAATVLQKAMALWDLVADRIDNGWGAIFKKEGKDDELLKL